MHDIILYRKSKRICSELELISDFSEVSDHEKHCSKQACLKNEISEKIPLQIQPGILGQ